jgi:hypothetical protein
MKPLPPQLVTPLQLDNEVVLKVVLDLTVYLVGPTEAELEALCDLYESVCPPGRLVAFRIDELLAWSDLGTPELTASAQRAAAAGVTRPYLEATRERIRAGRAFSMALWDHKEGEDPDGSWSMNVRSVKRRNSGLYSFVRFLLPLDTELELLLELARSVADTVAFHSGHGGLVFAYAKDEKEYAFDEIYARAARYWGVDIEDLDASILLTRDHIKGVNWLTLLGNGFANGVEGELAALRGEANVHFDKLRHGIVISAGPEPVPGDRNRQDPGLAPYFRVAEALASLFPTKHPDFDGDRFPANGNTLGWVRRFIEPSGW